MGTEWSREEDRQPGAVLVRPQPEKTARGYVYTQLCKFHHRQLKPDEPDFECAVQIMIRDDGRDFLFDYGNVFPVVRREDENDGA